MSSLNGSPLYGSSLYLYSIGKTILSEDGLSDYNITK